MRVTNVLMAGVGGQGIIMASDILSRLMLNAGLDVKKSEVHGMAQRGGSVTCHVRFGPHVFSPLIKQGEVDILMAFEKLEALRYLYYLRTGARVLLNDLEISPPSVCLGKESYPGGIPDLIHERGMRLLMIPGLTLARQAGNIRAANVVLLGVLSTWLDVEEGYWTEAIESSFPRRLVSVNLEAFRLGRAAGIQAS
ncbi:MAG: indolepyruvate oxidoreductase subunit beta [Deltaproteobacteria bacterium]|nr:indolepyruvate oxidoreductase subunit beta [Deltaproteobacteria bacterium]